MNSSTPLFKGKQKKSPYFSDVQLFQRVDKYLGERIQDDDINKEEMVEDLRRMYKEYARRNKSAFKMSVYKAYDIIKQTVNRSFLSDDLPESAEEVEEDEDDFNQSEFLDNSMRSRNTYLQNVQNMVNNSRRFSQKSKPNESADELINISSDEEEPKKTVSKNLNKGRKQNFPYFMDPSKFPDIQIRPGASDNQPIPVVGKQERKRKTAPMSSPYEPNLKKKKEVVPEVVQSITFKDFGGYPKVIKINCVGTILAMVVDRVESRIPRKDSTQGGAHTVDPEKTVSDLILHFYQFELFTFLGVSPPRGFLLHGPPGCGKTLLAHAVSGELGLPLVSVAGPELVGGMSGESEQRIRDLFARAKEQVPCVLFIDEIDAICQSRELARKDMERRIVSQLLASLDDLNECEEGNDLIVIGATNRLDTLDPALRRAGRFDKEVCIGIPDRTAREGILKVMCSKVKLATDVSLTSLAELTPGYVAADLKALISEAAVLSVRRIIAKYSDRMKNRLPRQNGVIDLDSPVKNPSPKESENNVEVEEVNGSEKPSEKTEVNEADKTNEPKESSVDEQDICEIIEENPKEKSEQPTFPFPLNHLAFAPAFSEKELDNLFIEKEDILGALKTVQPSAKREGFATVPDVSWDDVGSLRDIRDELKMSIMMPVKYPNEFTKMGVNAPSGIILCGPPGCGKTLLAKAVANEANINFISVKGPELLNMYVGESERAVRQCFQRAKNSQPCVIFFDEIDALCPKRSDTSEGTVSSRVVNQVLTEMDGVEGREGVFLMAATNRPDMVDPAVLRPGRFDKILYVGLPSPPDRVDILKTLTKNGTKPPLSPEVSLEEIGSSENCEGYSGADLAALVKEASVLALSEYICTIEGPPEDMTPCESPQLVIQPKHFTRALAKIRPSVTTKEQKKYEFFRGLYGQPGKSIDPDTEMDIET